jgi:trimethylamine--corrinoid protein Co-methyltransferase
VTLVGREKQVILGGTGLHVHNLGGARDVLDVKSGKLRPAEASDLVDSTRLMDGLENVDTITPLYTPRDVPGQLMILTMFDKTLRNTTKPINGPGVTSAREVQLLTEMMKVVLGGEPKVSLGASPVSPLNFTGEICRLITEIALRGLPLGPLPCPNVGATSPMSLAGSLVQQNAESLACIVIAQLVRPGLPIVYCGRLSVMNMRSGAPIWGNPEVGMLSSATVQLGHFYHLPVNVYGLAGSGFAHDMQSGYERAINALVPALAGADELSGVGEMAGGTISCNAQIVVDNDIYGMVRRVLQGFHVDTDSLAVDVIAHAIETTHNFLAEPHTRKYLRSGEIWQGRLGVQESSWDAWSRVGSPDVMGRATDEANKILTNHQITPIDESQSRALDEIMRSAERELLV